MLIGIAWAISEDRRGVDVRRLAIGLAIQIAVAVVLLRVPFIKDGLLVLNQLVVAIETATTAGTSLVFGFLGGETPPFVMNENANLYIFAFRVLPQILVFSVLVAILWYWRVLHYVVRGFAWALRRTLGVGGAVGVAASSSVFLGMVESPLVIRAYLAHLSRSELFTVMTCGMSTVAGSIMVLYANLLEPIVPGALGHVVTASIVNVFGAVVVARVMVPDTGVGLDGDVADSLVYNGTMDAITRGTSDGLRLVANVGSMVIVLVALVALVNYVISGIVVGGEPISLERIAGWFLSPIAWLMGVDWVDAQVAGTLLGTKVILNELIAYIQFGALGDSLSENTRIVMTYALCGFANFSSIGILIGGVSAMAPERKPDLFSLGPKALVSGTIVACITGTIAGLVS